MFIYPRINPVAFHLGVLKIHWYGLMYLLSFILGWFLMDYRARRFQLHWSRDQIADLVFYIAIGVLLGGRIGYMLFYDLSDFIHAPWIIIRVWDGGMSFHGGLLGVILMTWLWSRKQKKHFLDVTDFIAPIIPVGLAAGRIGNFLQGELWGKITNVPWAMVYPQAGSVPRHPSEIYEFLLEGVLLFIILWFYSAKPKPRMAVSALFLLGYGVFRFFAEFFRMPDPQYGYLAFGWLTMGQILSLPMVIIGAVLLVVAYRGTKEYRGT
ncbi:MAG: prolipoprotein diacylglyceryl transferase [Gammaproteobacteria bacterium]|jgi:phosphatidylglycerol:prolipoprotein diacylglycerol transferase